MRRRNTYQMKIKVLSSLLLGCLLVMIVQGDSSERVVSSGEKENKNKFEESTRKVPFVRIGAGHMIRKLGLGGKRFSRHEVMTSFDSKNGKGADRGGTSNISGKENDGLKKSFGNSREQKNDHDHQRQARMGPKEYLKFTEFVTPRSINPTNTKTKCSRHCISKSSSGSFEEPQGSAKKVETRRLVKTSVKEIANLMYMDYGNKGKPNHRPPINNHEPRNSYP